MVTAELYILGGMKIQHSFFFLRFEVLKFKISWPLKKKFKEITICKRIGNFNVWNVSFYKFVFSCLVVWLFSLSLLLLKKTIYKLLFRKTNKMSLKVCLRNNYNQLSFEFSIFDDSRILSISPQFSDQSSIFINSLRFCRSRHLSFVDLTIWVAQLFRLLSLYAS